MLKRYVKRFDRNTYLGVHFLNGKSLHVSDSIGRSLLESDSLESLVHVESIVSGSVLHFLLSSVFNHCILFFY